MTNEEYMQAVDMRCSRRTYKTKALDEATVSVIKDMVDYVNEKANLNFVYIEDMSFAFNIFSGKFGGIAVCGPDKILAREDCGYYGETIVLQCVYHGLGTCWVSGTYNENKVLEYLNLPKGIRLYAVITVGYVKPEKSFKEKAMYKGTHKNSKPYQKMFEVCDEKIPSYVENGMKAVEKAPSAVNRRPVKFRYENGVVSASVDEPYSDKSIDFGIAKLHFQLGRSAAGVKGEWINGSFLTEEQKILKFPKSNDNIEEEGGKNE